MESTGTSKGHRRLLYTRITRLWSSSAPTRFSQSPSDTSLQNSPKKYLQIRKPTAVAHRLKNIFLQTSSRQGPPHVSAISLVSDLPEHRIGPPTVLLTANTGGVSTTPPLESAQGMPNTPLTAGVEGVSGFPPATSTEGKPLTAKAQILATSTKLNSEAAIPVTVSINETKKYKSFTREPKHPNDSELKMLHYSYVMSESASLQEAVKLAHSLTVTGQTGPTAHDCAHLAEMSSAYIMTVINYQQQFDAAPLDVDSTLKDFIDVLREIHKTIYELPLVVENKIVEDWKREKVVTNQCKKKLVSVISESQRRYPALGHPDDVILGTSQDSAVNSRSIASSILDASIILLTILKEAVDIAPVPFLKGSVGTILMILQTAQITRSNREDILEVAYMAENFVASIWEACQGSNEALSDEFQGAVNTLTKMLSNILEKTQAFSQKRLLSRIVGQNNDKNEIMACKQQLQNAIGEFQAITTILQQHTLDAILASQNEIIETTHDMLLKSLPRAPLAFGGDNYVTSTRTDVLETITEWIENPAKGTQVFWLHGAAGMGKSTITRHLQEVLESSRRLAGYFFFQRQSKDQERPEFMIEALARQLALVDKGMKTAVINALQHPLINQQFIAHFQALVLDPLNKGTFPLPTVILFDALDEYQYASGFIDVLVKLISRFPPNVKVFITSRPELHIRSEMQKLDPQQCELPAASAEAVQSIFEDRLQKIGGWKQYPGAAQISQLVELADGLPIWATTACTFISKTYPGYPDRTFNEFLQSQSAYRLSAESPLYVLYLTTLTHIFPTDLQAGEFRRIFGFMYVLKGPLTGKEVEVLLGENEWVEPLMNSLSVLNTRASSNFSLDMLVTPVSKRFHASFLDFLVDTQRCLDTRFHLDVTKIHVIIARQCFKLMDKLFESAESGSYSSYTNLSNAHRYAVDNWAAHTYETTMLADLHTTVFDFTIRHFSAWFQFQFESVTGVSMSPEIVQLYGSSIISDASVHRFAHFAVLLLYMQQMGHSVDIVHLNMAIYMQLIALDVVSGDDPKITIHFIISGRLHMSRYKQSDRLEDVKIAIEHYQKALAICPPNNPRRPSILNDLGVALLARGGECSTKGDLNQAIEYFSDTFKLLPEHSTTVLINNRANAYRLRFQKFGEIADLKEALSLHREAVSKSQGLTGTTCAEYTNDLADSLDLWYDKLGSSNDLDAVITLRREALGLFQETRGDRVAVFDNLVNALQTASIYSGDGDDLYNAIPLCREVLTIHLSSNYSRSSTLRNLAHNLVTRFELAHNSGDLDEAISLYRQVLELRLHGHSKRSFSLHDLANALISRYGNFRKGEDLDEAISLHRQGLELRPFAHPTRDKSLDGLGIALLSQFERYGKVEDLDEAISLHRQALERRPPSHSDQNDRAFSLHNLGHALYYRCHKIGEIGDLDEAISLLRQGHDLWPPDHPNRAYALFSLDTLGSALRTRSEKIDDNIGDLDEAILLHRQGLDLWPLDHPTRANSFVRLGNALHSRFQKSDKVEDLDEAIILHRQGLELRPPGQPDRAFFLHSLANALQSRYDNGFEVQALDEAISLYRQTLELRPPGNPERAFSLHGLGNALHCRFDRFGEDGELDEAISLHRQALELWPPSHPVRPYSLNSLGDALRSRFASFGENGNLDEAILLNRQALELRPFGHPDRAFSLNSLGGALRSQYEKNLELKDLDEATSLHRQALELRSPGLPNRAESLNSLAYTLQARPGSSGQAENLDEAIMLSRQSLVLSSQPAFLDTLGCALHARFLISDRLEDLNEAVLLLRQVFKLRPSNYAHTYIKLGNALHTQYKRFGNVEDLNEAISLLRHARELRPFAHIELPEKAED